MSSTSKSSSTSGSTSAPSSVTAKVPLHQKLRRVDKPAAGKQPTKLGQSIDQQILKLVGSNFNEKTIRTKLLQIALSCDGAIGACFLTKDAQGQWAPAISHPTVGRIPNRQEFATKLSDKCDDVAGATSVKIEKLPSLKNSPALLAPLRPRKSSPEILLIVVRSQIHAISATASGQKLASSLQLWLNGRDAADADWQVYALSAIIELIGKIENQSTPRSAAEEAANLLANRIGCNSVAIGLYRRNKLQLEAISGVSKIDMGSDLSRNYMQALVESTTRKQPGLHPAANGNNNFLLQAHKQLAGFAQCEAVYSQPLVCDDDTVIGAIVMTGTRAVLQSTQVERFSNTAAPAISNALRVVDRAKHSTIARTKVYLKRKVSLAKRVLALGLVVGFVWLMFLPITYRVRCNCVTEPVSRRFAVAPFDGQISVGHAEAGDFVESGQVLAEMDGQTIRWELSGVTAEREQSLRTREIKLFERNVPEAILSELEHKRLVSEEEIWNYKKDHLQIKSPIDGIPVKVWIDGQEDEPIEGEIMKIHPRSETRDAKNVFIAEIEFPNEDERLRPGMKGSVRIDGEERSLGWSLFHKPMNYVRSRFTWW